MIKRVAKILDDIDSAQQSEGRAITECIRDALSDLPPNEQLNMARAMAEEFQGFSEMLVNELKAGP